MDPGYEFEPLTTHCPNARSNSKAGRRYLAERRNAGWSLALRGPSDNSGGVTRLGGSGHAISTGGERRWGFLGMMGAHQNLQGMNNSGYLKIMQLGN